ncbi:AAA family ATPase [Escherichia coli]
MSLTRLLIRDFRNIETADLALSPGFNFLVGANGSGKTSVLEAIYTLTAVGRFAVCRLVASFATSRRRLFSTDDYRAKSARRRLV